MALPPNIAFEQAQAELTACINYCLSENIGIRLYEAEIILRNAHAEVARLAREEYNRERAAYEASLNENTKEQTIEEKQEPEKSEN